MDWQFIGQIIAGAVIIAALVAIFVLVEWQARARDEQRREHAAEIDREAHKVAIAPRQASRSTWA